MQAGPPPVRPRGITYLAVYYWILGVGLVVVTAYAVYGVRQIPEALRVFLYAPEALLVIAVCVAGVHWVASYGLWRLQPWSRLFVVALSILGIAAGMLTLPWGFASVILNFATFWYVTEARTRAFFRRTRA